MEKRKLVCGLLGVVLLLGGSALKAGWLDGWSSRIPITINNPAALTDYQIKVVLNPGNFDYNGVQDDGDDIRFTTGDGETLLNYFMASWKEGEREESTFWVKVPSLSAGTTTFWMYYGNTSVSSASNGNGTFSFFDDFDSFDSTKWNTELGGSATYYFENSTVIMDNQGIDGSSVHFVLRSTPTFSQAVVFKMKFASCNRGGSKCEWSGGGEELAIHYIDSKNKFFFSDSQKEGAVENQWYIGQYCLYNNKARGFWDDLFYSKEKGANTPTKFWIGVWSDGNRQSKYIYDWLGIRKYTAAEPVVNAGTTKVFFDDFQAYSVGASPTGWTPVGSHPNYWNIQDLGGGSARQYRKDNTNGDDERSFLDRTDLWRGLYFKTAVYVDARSGTGGADKSEMLIFYRDQNNYVRLQMFYDKIVICEHKGGTGYERAYRFYGDDGWEWGTGNWYELRAYLTVGSSSTTVKFGIYQGGVLKSECTATIDKYTSGKFGLGCWGEKTYFDDVEVQAVPYLSISVSPDSYSFGEISKNEQKVSTSAINVSNSGNITITFGLSCSSTTALVPVSSDPKDNEFRMLALFNSSQPASGLFSIPNTYLVTDTRYSSATIFKGDQSGQDVPAGQEQKLWLRLDAPTLGIPDTSTQQAVITITGSQ